MHRWDWQIYSPIVRQNLLRSTLNKKIVDISIFSDRVSDIEILRTYLIDGTVPYERTFSGETNFTIEFEGGVHIDFVLIHREFMMVLRSNMFGHKWGAYFGGFASKPSLWSVKDDLLKNLDIHQAIGQTVESIKIFRLKKIKYHPNPYGVELQLSNGQSLVLGKVNFDKDREVNIFYTTEKYADFKDLEKIETPLEHAYTYSHQESRSEYYIHESEVLYFLEDNYSQAEDHLFNIKTDIYADVLSKNPEENYLTLNVILNAMLNEYEQYAIPDLRFGLSKEGIIKVAYPFDIFPNRVSDRNINFIYALRHEIEKTSWKAIDKFYNS